MKPESREYGFDLLRLICTISVVVIHVSGNYKVAILDLNNPYRVHMLSTLIFDSVSRFAVPCFLMLSGAFLLSNEKNKDYKLFYRKSLINIGIPTTIFTIFYFLYVELRVILKIISGNGNFYDLLNPIRNVFIGSPYYHMWYLFPLIGIYILIPLIIRIKACFDSRTFQKLTWIYFGIATISYLSSSYTVYWSIGSVMCYLSYVLVGYQLRHVQRKDNIKGLLCIWGGVLFEIALSFVQYDHYTRGISESAEKYSLVSAFYPLVIAASLLIFYGFSLLEIKCDKVSNVAKDSFYIYLFHAGIWSVFYPVLFKFTGGFTDPIFTIPLCVITVFCISWLFARLYLVIWKVLNIKFDFDNRICDRIGLYKN